MASKTAGGRVDRDSFVRAMLHKHKDKITSDSTPAYLECLNRCFDSGIP